MPRRFRYSAWDGTQTVDDLDAGDVLDELVDDVLYHGDLTSALRRMMQQGFTARNGEEIEGLREMLGRLRERRRELLDRHDPNGVLDDIRERLDDVVRTEEDGVERMLREDATREAQNRGLDRLEQLHRMPDDAGARLRELQNYDFVSAAAREKFEDLLGELRAQAMQQFSSQLSEGLRNMPPEQMQRMKDMMAELNEMLRRRASGIEPDFPRFMEEYGDFFPESPQSLDELLEQLARRMLAMQMLLQSMTDEQRAELESVLDALMEDMDLRWQADEMGRLLQEALPSLPWDQGFDFRGQDPLDLAGGMNLMDALAQMEGLDQFMAQVTDPAMLSEIDPEQIRDLLGPDAERSLRRLQQITQKLQEAGLIDQRDGRFELTPKGMRRIGQKVLGELFTKPALDRMGEHEQNSRGALGEPTYQTRPYRFGDPFLMDVGRTIRNAVMREAGASDAARAFTGRVPAGAGRGGDRPASPAARMVVRIAPDDFEIEETEHLTRTATVLMLDLSLSMPMRDNFLAAKKVAVALHALISSRFPRDYLGIVGFSEVARQISPEDLPKASYDFVYGTNMQHAFMLARRLLAKYRAATRQIIMITDGEPTAHIENGIPVFNYPPIPRTIEETLREVVRCTRDEVRINTFMLDESRALRRFVERMTEMNGGRAFFTTPQTLGEYVLVDYLEHKRQQLKS